MDQISPQKAMPTAQIASRIRRAFDVGQATPDFGEARRLLPAWGFVAFSALCVSAMVLAGALSSSDCRVEPIPVVLGSDSEISIRLSAGIPCTILVKPGSIVIEKIDIDIPPERGTLTPRGRTGVIYRPRAGFSGEDTFAFSLGSRSGSTSSTSTVRVRAKIG
jgi:hypothetical protein